MFELVCVAAGCLIGSIITRFILDRQCGYGVFDIEPGNDPEDPEITNLRIKIFSNQYLYNKKKIILYRDSHK